VPVYWRWTPTVSVPFFVAGLVDNEHRMVVMKVFDHVVA
jgi:hypothetical protein